MKKNLFSLLISVIAGVAVGLTITLRLWGPEWYKVIVAVLAGIVGGLVTNDPKEFLEIIKQAFRQSLGTMSQIPYLGQKITAACARKMSDIKIVVTRAFFRFALLVAMLLFYTVVTSAIAGIAFYLGAFSFFHSGVNSGLSTLGGVCIIGMCLYLAFITLFSSEVSVWHYALSDEENDRIWKGKLSWRSLGCQHDAFIAGYFWEAVYSNCSYAEIFSAIMRTIAWVYFRALWRLAKNIFGLVIFLPTWILILALDAILFIFMLLHIAAALRSRLVIMVSIALGVVLGTVFSSFLLGFAISSSSAIIGHLTGKYFPDEINSLITSFNGAKVIANTRGYLFQSLFRA
jgi:hypothetical protein